MKFSRKDGNILTQMFVIVSPQDPVEIRRISITNLSQYSRDIQLTSYFEVVLDRLAADAAHPAFSKLFIQTGFENDTLFAFRRSRNISDQENYLMHTFYVDGNLIAEPEYETDRSKFIGRGRTLSNPLAMEFNQPLTKTTGAVLDPIMSIRGTVRVEGGKTVHVFYLTGVGESKERVFKLAEKYRNSYVLQPARELSWSQDLMKSTYLGLTFAEESMINALGSHIIFPGPARSKRHIKANRLGQSALWPYGISGDFPIILLKIQENSQHRLIDDMLKIHEYWNIKGLAADLVIMNEDNSGYFQFIQEMIQEKISISHARRMVNKPGGVYVLKKDQLADETITLLHTVARLVFSGESGSLSNQLTKLSRLEDQYPSDPMPARDQVGVKKEKPSYPRLKDKLSEILLYFNGYGGFSQDGKEYVILVDRNNPTPLPWSNVLANPGFGTLVTEAGLGYTWSQNSREYKLSPWSNDPLLDIGGEALYLKDHDAENIWSPTPQPAGDSQAYIVRHGQGYTVFEQHSQGFNQEISVFVPLSANIKIVKLTLTNQGDQEKKLSAYYYLEWVLGVQRGQSAPYLLSEWHEDAILCRNVYQEEFSGRVAFLGRVGGDFKSFTCDRKDFIGINSSLQEPLGVLRDKLSAKTGNALDPCAVIETGVTLRPGEKKSIYFLVGDAPDKAAALSLFQSFRDPQKIDEAYREIVAYWDELLSVVQVKTPEPTLDLLCNRWLLYQTLGCRIWARSAFYQAGGAFGFRDQLQDVMSFSFLRPEITRRQILLHSSRQFPEGDVHHWWHAEKGKGIRTRF
jgi:cellobiose phosphorylase